MTPLDQPSITIREESLTESHGAYTFTVTVTDTIGSASSYITFAVNKAPFDGIFEVEPSTGIELTTQFVLRAKHWNDVEQNFPLNYQYFTDNGTGLKAISSKILENNFGTILTKSPSVGTQVYVRVFDSLNAYSQATYAVTVTAATVDIVQASSDLKKEVSTVFSQETILSTTAAYADSAFSED